MLLIVGFLLAGVLKGQEMITSAKVKRVAGQLDEMRAAYLGFQDRYKALPGDYADANSTLTCSGTCLFGNGDSRIRANETPLNGSQVHEDLLVWSHLSSSGFLKGDYRMSDGESQPTDLQFAQEPLPDLPTDCVRRALWNERRRYTTPQLEDGRPATGGRALGTGSEDRRWQTLQGRASVLDLPGQQRCQPDRGWADQLYHRAGSGSGLESTGWEPELRCSNGVVAEHRLSQSWSPHANALGPAVTKSEAMSIATEN